MLYPKFKNIPSKITRLSAFGGFTGKAAVPESSFSDMENLTSDSFPLMKVRKKRGRLNYYNTENGKRVYTDAFSLPGSRITSVIKVNDKVCICTDTSVIIDGSVIADARLNPMVERRTAVAFGRNILIVPDALYIMETPEGFTVTQCQMPFMDMAVEHNNRVFGCRYGKNGSGVYVNEIYASKLGDPTQWYSLQGISTDPYTASLGCTGEFTGVSAISEGVIFFKEEFIIRVTGDTPSDFSVFSFPARGVEKGSSQSVVSLNEKIFYKSRDAVMVYDGALPYSISESFGSNTYSKALAGTAFGKYYVSMVDTRGRRRIFVYDTKNGLWHIEDDNYGTLFMLNISGILCSVFSVSEGLYGFWVNDAEASSGLFAVLGENNGFEGYEYIPEKEVVWSAQSARLGEKENPVRQYLRKLSVTLSLEEGASLSLYIMPDDANEWQRVLFIDDASKEVFTVPVVCPKCYSFRLRYEGTGGCTLYSLARHTEGAGGVINNV